MSKNSTKMGGKIFFSNILNAVGAGVVLPYYLMLY